MHCWSHLVHGGQAYAAAVVTSLSSCTDMSHSWQPVREGCTYVESETSRRLSVLKSTLAKVYFKTDSRLLVS